MQTDARLIKKRYFAGEKHKRLKVDNCCFLHCIQCTCILKSINKLQKWQKCFHPQNLTCASYSLQPFREMKWPVIVPHKFGWTGTFLGNDSYFSAANNMMDIFRSSLCPYIHPSIPAGALEETKDREDSVLRGGSPPFYLKGRHKPYYLPVTATNYCWLPGSASTSTCMNGQTQAALSFYKALLLLPRSFTHSASTCCTPLTSRWPIWHADSRPNSTQGLRLKVKVEIWFKLVTVSSCFGLWQSGLG